ncbi:uncharacterized protein TRIADDRAFT_54622 [Trichoplax adhaerens]|uniref:Caspase family p20 domain-containing protein n=1 Tax=Trichoplax adhaerens TaxID=10228 RepID=B3RSJ7_TRIAD|nr:hypothetical protein TRIADDRAFT_54622 [Trichoplax adhaerens]EDV27071.1 hypothetical protein TRIADDRAFT_54622 [Trichoplax adhaerens]|eukprot:XP_002111067.1 hypothetical protein TRIADDRAFT_54622 [Trichoplax adhaerens]
MYIWLMKRLDIKVTIILSSFKDDHYDYDSLASSNSEENVGFPEAIPHPAESGRHYHQKLPQFADIPRKVAEDEYGYYNPSLHMATAKYALILCNQNYLYNPQKLNHCLHDALVMSKQLTELDFKVMTLVDVTLEEAEAALAMMNRLIRKDSYVFVYLVGHGLNINEKRYFTPIDAKPEILDSRQHLAIPDIIHLIAKNDPKWIVFLCDTCGSSRVRDHESDVGHYEERLPDIGQNIFLAYSSGFKAYERGFDTNGLYVKHLKNYLTQMDMTIDEIFEKTKEDVINDYESQEPYHVSNMTDIELSLCDDVVQTAEKTPSDIFWDQLHGYQIEPRISIRDPKLEIEAALAYDEFYDALLTLRVKYLENVDYCDVHVVGFHTNIESDETIVKLERVKSCIIDKQQGFVPNLVINATGFLNLRKIRGTGGFIEVVIYTGKCGGRRIRQFLKMSIPPICTIRNWTNFVEFQEVKETIWNAFG